MKPKVIFIVGPTAIGKTGLAFDIAPKFNGTLISADSVQVYKNLDIISGKDLPPKYKFKNGYYSCFGLPSIYLLDVVEPTSSFNISDFFKLASNSIDNISKGGKLPIVVGGTGLYVEALLNGLYQTIEPDYELRKKLEQKKVSDLKVMLKKINEQKFSSMNDSDRNNKRRLIRAIEISSNTLINHQPSDIDYQYDSLVVGLKCEREVLKKRIDERVKERIKQGALEEATRLFENYENLNDQVKNANGYKQLFSFLKKEIDFDEAIYRWKISEYQHAKNQMTWFRKYGNVIWFDIGKKDFKKEIEEQIINFLKPLFILP